MGTASPHKAFRRSKALQTAKHSNEVAINSQSIPSGTVTVLRRVVRQNAASGSVEVHISESFVKTYTYMSSLIDCLALREIASDCKSPGQSHLCGGERRRVATHTTENQEVGSAEKFCAKDYDQMSHAIRSWTRHADGLDLNLNLDLDLDLDHESKATRLVPTV
ncbi:hypothetical protein V9T40_000239 [Parthenolecanium corni]|uniref:Uncharacterized protein n=1 Tax=Parthenolecanium corni TaxID=536013 RepID=A0AAN9Y1E6_9HEMI